MDNYLPNGSVLPFGLMGSDAESTIAGFNKTYRNSAMRMGIVVKSYDVSNPSNLTKLTTEYDVLVFEQVEDRGSTVLTYRNCISAEGMGSIADFFERTLRVRNNTAQNKTVTNTSGQNGAVVLILCLDSVTEKAIIVGSVTHPDRQTTLAGQTEFLEGEFNGCNIQVASDGSATFTFKGATDNDGNPINSSQGNTVVSISSDGSFQIKHSTVTVNLARSGQVNIQASGDVDISCNNANITAQADANVKAAGSATIDAPAINLGAGAADAVIKGDTFKKMVFDVHIHPTPIGSSGPPSQPMDPSSLSTVVKTK